MSFVFSEENIKKNFFRIFVRNPVNGDTILPFAIANGEAAGKDVLGATPNDPASFATTTGMFHRLYTAGWEQIGSCNAEPTITSADVEGITNNIGTKNLGASKDVTVNFVLNDLDGGEQVPYVTGGDNYNALIALDGRTVDVIYFDEKTGTLNRVEGINASINLETTGNAFENVPFAGTKEVNSIPEAVTRFKLKPGDTGHNPTGEVTRVSITTAGLGYAVNDVLDNNTGGSGAGFEAEVVAVTGVAGDEIYAIAITAGGTDYAIGDVITVDTGGGVATPATITVTGIN